MPWEPEKFTRAERHAARAALARTWHSLWQLDPNEFGPYNAEVTVQAYRRVDDMLAMIYDDLYGLDGSGAQPPQPPSMS